MKMLTKPAMIAGLLCALYLGATTQVQADPVTFSINNPVHSVTAGSTITFVATISNPNPQAFAYWNPAIGSWGSPTGILTIMDDVFISPNCPFPIAFPANTTLTGAYLTFAISPNAAPGAYNGFIQFVGFYPNGQAVGLEDYVTINIVPSGVPEPTSMILLGSGLLGSAGVFRWRRRNVK